MSILQKIEDFLIKHEISYSKDYEIDSLKFDFAILYEDRPISFIDSGYGPHTIGQDGVISYMEERIARLEYCNKRNISLMTISVCGDVEYMLWRHLMVAPIKGSRTSVKPWEGRVKKKPWDWEITAVVPVLDTYEELALCIELLKLQSNPPYIIVIDTGSSVSEYDKIKTLRAEDCEVHAIRSHATPHPSDFVAQAMDLGFTLCRTDYLFATHADCFLRKRTLLEEMLEMTKTISPVVGYEITERSFSGWEGMCSHTASMYHMPTMDKIGAGWSQRRLLNFYDIEDKRPQKEMPGFPDTEILLGYILRANKIEPHLIGKEENFARNKDENIDHCRSLTSGKLYNPKYYAICKKWVKEAKVEAKERIEEWKKIKVS